MGGDEYSADGSYSGRGKIDSRDPDIEKANQRNKKVASKKMKKDENFDQYSKPLGANEQEGNARARKATEDRAQQERDLRETLISGRGSGVQAAAGGAPAGSSLAAPDGSARSGGQTNRKKEVMKALADSKKREQRVKEDER